jgi:amidohydrolase family protein
VREAILDYARPGLFDQIARRFPDMRLVLGHLGHPYEGECIATIRKRPNVVSALLGTMPGPDLNWAIRRLRDALVADDAPSALEITSSLSTLISMASGLDGYVAFGNYLLAQQGVIGNDRMRGPVGFRLDAVTRRLIDVQITRLRELVP